MVAMETSDLGDPPPTVPSFSEEWFARFKFLSRRRDILWSTWESAINGFMDGIKDYMISPAARAPSGPKRSGKFSNKAICRLYRHNPKKAVSIILNDRKFSSPLCAIDKNYIERAFKHTYREKTLGLAPDFLAPFGTASDSQSLLEPFSVADVFSALESSCQGGSSPGTSGITFSHLSKADPKAMSLALILNACLKFQRIPQSWKESKTSLLLKGGDKAELSNWRPIAITETLYRLYTKLLAKRLLFICDRDALLSPLQKGFLSFNGCADHNFVVQSMLDSSRMKCKDFHAVWLDISKAFDSVCHELIWKRLAICGLPQ